MLVSYVFYVEQVNTPSFLRCAKCFSAGERRAEIGGAIGSIVCGVWVRVHFVREACSVRKYDRTRLFYFVINKPFLGRFHSNKL